MKITSMFAHLVFFTIPGLGMAEGYTALSNSSEISDRPRDQSFEHFMSEKHGVAMICEQVSPVFFVTKSSSLVTYTAVTVVLCHDLAGSVVDSGRYESTIVYGGSAS